MVEVEDFLPLTNLRLNESSASKAELFEELARIAAAEIGLEPAAVLAALEQREKLGTTGIGDGVAIPHARLPGLGRLTGFFVRLKTPIEYDALDNAHQRDGALHPDLRTGIRARIPRPEG